MISEESAAQLSEMMTNVTREGTAAGLSVAGVEFAGKTGTAEIDLEGTNQPWFIMFAPPRTPRSRSRRRSSAARAASAARWPGRSPPRSLNRSSTR